MPLLGLHVVPPFILEHAFRCELLFENPRVREVLSWPRFSPTDLPFLKALAFTHIRSRWLSSKPSAHLTRYLIVGMGHGEGRAGCAIARRQTGPPHARMEA